MVNAGRVAAGKYPPLSASLLTVGRHKEALGRDWSVLPTLQGTPPKFFISNAGQTRLRLLLSSHTSVLQSVAATEQQDGSCRRKEVSLRSLFQN